MKKVDAIKESDLMANAYIQAIINLAQQVEDISEQQQIAMAFAMCASVFTVGCSRLLLHDEKVLDDSLEDMKSLVKKIVMHTWGLDEIKL